MGMCSFDARIRGATTPPCAEMGKGDRKKEIGVVSPHFLLAE
jgi:hypothetical protein